MVWCQGHLHLRTKFHPNPPIDLKLVKRVICTHVRSLNVRHGMAEAARLKNVALRSPSMATPVYKIS
jgi:hypothetical protein